MKKRLLSLALCLAMLLPTLVLFTSCSEEDTAEEGTIVPMTIVIAMMTDEKTNEAGIAATERALNRITESNYNTHVELKLYTESEYYTKLEEQLLARRDAVEAGDKATSLGAVTDKIFDEEKNREVTAYPEAYENQIDIFFVGSREKLDQYRMWKYDDASDEDYETDPVNNSESLLSSLDASLDEFAPLLSKYLSQGLLNAGRIYFENAGELVAIPSNNIYDDGEYMIIDKKLFDSYSYSLEDVSGVVALEDFLVDVATDHADVTPLYNLGSMNFESFTGTTTMIGRCTTEATAADDTEYFPGSLLSAGEVRNTLDSVMKYASINDKYPIPGSDLSGAEAGKFAVGFLTANEQEIAAYEDDYYVIEFSKSLVTTEQACSNMFAVSAFTSDVDRCMEIINLLQTNKEAHNVLVYGEENETYVVDESTKMIKRQYDGDAVYVMDIHKSGNLFITYQNTEMTEEELLYSANDWALAKSATRHVYYGPITGFVLQYAETEEDATLWKPSKDNLSAYEELYNQMLVEAFEYETAVDDKGQPYATYLDYLTALDTKYKTANGNLVGTQLAATAGKKNIYRQYLDWKKIHYMPAS